MKGYAREYGVDYTEVLALVARVETICLVVALASQKGWTLYQQDVNSAFFTCRTRWNSVCRPTLWL